MRTVGADADALLLRRPLELRYPDGRGLRLPPGPAGRPSHARWLAAQAGRWRERLALLRAAGGWALAGFRCAPQLTVDAALPPPAARRARTADRPAVRGRAQHAGREASAEVFLRVLRDALLRRPRLGRPAAAATCRCRRCCPSPAGTWLHAAGADAPAGHRVQTRCSAGPAMAGRRRSLRRRGAGLHRRRGGAPGRPIAPDWAAVAAALRYEPIVTVYLAAPARACRQPMVALLDERRCARAVRLRPWRLRRGIARLSSPSSSAARGRGSTAGSTPRAAAAAPGPGGVPPAPGRAAAGAAPVWPRSRATFPCTPALQRARRCRSRQACWPPATTSPGPTRPRSKAQCVPAKRGAAALDRRNADAIRLDSSHYADRHFAMQNSNPRTAR